MRERTWRASTPRSERTSTRSRWLTGRRCRPPSRHPGVPSAHAHPTLRQDLIISSSVLEHVECPVQELRELRRKLRPAGRLVLGIKNEGVEVWRRKGRPWFPDNKDKHLYTWNMQLICNLLDSAGYIIQHVQSDDDSIKGLQGRVVAAGFGRKGGVFQYLWVHARAPKEGEVFEFARWDAWLAHKAKYKERHGGSLEGWDSHNDR